MSAPLRQRRKHDELVPVCPACNGTKRKVCDRYTDGRPAGFKPCKECNGTGKLLAKGPGLA